MKQHSKLLIDESPLQVLPSLAVAIGLNEAIVLQQIQYWLRTSKHKHDERLWIYNTVEEWAKQFPFWSGKTIQRIIASLREKGFLLTRSDLNKNPFDHTLWYAIDYDCLNTVIESLPIGTTCPNGQSQDVPILYKRLPENTTVEETIAPPPPHTDGFRTVVAAYERNIGAIGEIISEQLKAAYEDMGETLVVDAITEAVRSNVRKWSYVDGILKRWKANGRSSPKDGADSWARLSDNLPDYMRQ